MSRFIDYPISHAQEQFSMTPAMDRLESERAFHNLQARERAATFQRRPADLRFSDDDYLDHESWIRPAFAKLGGFSGRRALDYGCGHGMAAVVMARRGAIVSAFDLSEDYVTEARLRAVANGVAVEFQQADAHSLPFSDESFDAVWGNAILHHLDLGVAAHELRRVLRPGGVAVFCEPWGGNTLLRFARNHLPYPGKGRTRGEEPLCECDLDRLREVFPNYEIEGFQLTAMVRRAVRIEPLAAALDRLDRNLLAVFPRWKRWCRYVVLTLHNRARPGPDCLAAKTS
jgi:2-polyprenyl-3-methyl-5-hydroxy-6-metoxy-1,4-benzoquinol methylase